MPRWTPAPVDIIRVVILSAWPVWITVHVVPAWWAATVVCVLIVAGVAVFVRWSDRSMAKARR